ncbi:hypothetical protein WISP_76681 [Willisornis vidua]|uniref:Uncharacterized protein n=1 Tax=Willisornis vidua TaxID=1566151 RepID=A0ABQ9DBF7_9PASS|nr:hypothetical protein WISP_76681 [Willisornis vidua]
MRTCRRVDELWVIDDGGDLLKLKPACSAAKGRHLKPWDRSPGVSHREQDCSKTSLRKGENIREEEKTSKAPLREEEKTSKAPLREEENHGDKEESSKIPLREDKTSKEKRAAKKPRVVNWTLAKRVKSSVDS